MTKISILAPQVYDICSLGGDDKLYVYPKILGTIILNIVILWELSGIKSTEEQYIIAIYQIDTNYISVQAWSRFTYLY